MDQSKATDAGQRSARPSILSERNLRLGSGLVLFAYLTGHLLSLAAGLLLFDAMKAVGAVLMAPWQSPLGQVLLYGALLLHTGLALTALWRRRYLRMPATEACQTALGLMIPLVLLAHLADLRLASLVYGVDNSFESATLLYWVLRPLDGMIQAGLVVLAWAHGCVGLHLWLRHRPMYHQMRTSLFGIAVIVPLVALLGFMNAGFDVGGRVEADPSVVARVQAASGGATSEQATYLKDIGRVLVMGYLALVGGVLVGRAGREVWTRLKHPVAITYPGGRTIVVPRGTSVLEASRYGGLPHASVCGGRGRCSTCRVRVLSGGAGLQPPRADEAATLARIGAPASIRLACQIRPTVDLTVAPVIEASPAGARAATPSGQREGIGMGREMQVAAVAVDLRESTALAATKLPFDALFIVDRYVQTVRSAIEESGGQVVCVAGDGVMALFGLHGNPGRACREAVRAVRLTLSGMDRLNRDLASELEAPLRIGIGAAFGTAVVGEIGLPGSRSVQFLGDVGNLAARLEAETKVHGTPALATAELLGRAGEAAGDREMELMVRGWEGPVRVAEVERSRSASGEMVEQRPATLRRGSSA